MKKLISLILAACMITALFAGCAGGGDKKDTSLQDVLDAGVLIVGTSADYAPYEFHIMEDGVDKIVGFDIDLAQAIADHLGVTLEIHDANFDGLIAEMNAGKVDIVIAGLSPDPERECDFSDIYYKAKQGVLVKSDMTDKFKSLDDFAGLDVGAQSGTIQATILEEQMAESNPVLIAKIPDLVLELKNNKVSGVVMEVPVAEGYAAKDSSLAVADIEVAYDQEGSAIAVKKGDASLLAEINKVIAELLESGKMDEFVFAANELASQN
jgi:ABC-type amino acid transport substrate-binding protein